MKGVCCIMNLNVKILDSSGNLIGERFDISNEDIRKYLSKGFRVIDLASHIEITEESLMATIGVSECII